MSVRPSTSPAPIDILQKEWMTNCSSTCEPLHSLLRLEKIRRGEVTD